METLKRALQGGQGCRGVWLHVGVRELRPGVSGRIIFLLALKAIAWLVKGLCHCDTDKSFTGYSNFPWSEVSSGARSGGAAILHHAVNMIAAAHSPIILLGIKRVGQRAEPLPSEGLCASGLLVPMCILALFLWGSGSVQTLRSPGWALRVGVLRGWGRDQAGLTAPCLVVTYAYLARPATQVTPVPV